MNIGSNTRPASREEGAGQSRPSGVGTPNRRLGRKTKGIIYQVATVALIIGFFAYLVRNVIANTRALNVETGFGFLQKPAGFAISQTLITYDRASTYFDTFLAAFLNTISLTVVCILIATVFGIIVALARISSNPVVSRVAVLFIEVVRNIPLLLHLLIWYFVVVRALPNPRDSISVFGLFFVNNRGFFFPALSGGLQLVVLFWAASLALCSYLLFKQKNQSAGALGSATARFGWVVVGLLAVAPLGLLAIGTTTADLNLPKMTGFNFTGGAKVVPEFVAMTLGIAVYSTAFIAEVFRGGLNSVPGGLREAGLALGLKSWFVNYKIVVPLALRAAMPPLGGQYIIMLKNTSLAAAIAYPDLMQVMAGTVLNQTGQPLEVMLITLGAYVFLGLLISLVVNMLNRRLALVSR